MAILRKKIGGNYMYWFVIILMVIILLQLFMNWYLAIVIDKIQEEDRKFYAKLRKEFDDRVKKLKMQYEERDEYYGE